MELYYFTELENIGLHKDEARVYECLVRFGRSQASMLAKRAGLSRPLAYRALNKLVTLGLVKKEDEKAMVSRFSALHPSQLQALVEQKNKTAESSRSALDGILGKLVSDFTKISGQPGIRFLSGIEGLKNLNIDIEKSLASSGEALKIFRTPHDSEDPSVTKLIREHISRRVKNGTKTMIIGALLENFTWEIYEKDKKRLTERRFVPSEKLLPEAQINIYDDKVAIIHYGKDLFITMIENKAIALTFSSIFQFVWEHSGDYNEQAKNKLLSQKPKGKMPDHLI